MSFFHSLLGNRGKEKASMRISPSGNGKTKKYFSIHEPGKIVWTTTNRGKAQKYAKKKGVEVTPSPFDNE